MGITCARCGHTGGRFTWRKDHYLCATCAPEVARGGHVFPYTSTNIDGSGRAITVNSLHHLRQLEKQHKVTCAAFSLDRSNWER